MQGEGMSEPECSDQIELPSVVAGAQSRRTIQVTEFKFETPVPTHREKSLPTHTSSDIPL